MDKVILHHTVTGHNISNAKLKTFGYNWIVRWNGGIVKGRGNAHTYGQNDKIGIALVGNFMNEHPSKKQLKALIAKLRQLKIKKVTGHRDWRNKPWGHNFTACPGTHLYSKLPYIRKQIKSNKINKMKLYRKKGKGTIYYIYNGVKYPIRSIKALKAWWGNAYTIKVKKTLNQKKGFVVDLPGKMGARFNSSGILNKIKKLLGVK